MTRASDRVMVMTAHPDDPEFGAGGTIAKLVKEGREVTYVIVTNGNKGSSDRAIAAGAPGHDPRDRAAECRPSAGRRACRVPRLRGRRGRGYASTPARRDPPDPPVAARPDHHADPNRTYGNFHGWHRDHRITAGVVLDCVYPLARDHLSFPELLPDYEPHKVREVYLIQWEQPALLVDITETMALKLEAITCHASQVGRLQSRRGPAATALRRPRDGEGLCLRRRVRPCRAAGLKIAS